MRQVIRQCVSDKTKWRLRRLAFRLNQINPLPRVAPDFLTIGAQRSGTTFLHSVLINHPHYMRPLKSALNYFSMNADQPERRYRAQFPTCLYKRTRRAICGGEVVTGESNPYYLLHPAVPGRVHALYPDMKIIMLLRNPTDRAISHYYHNRHAGREELDLMGALQAEDERLAGEFEKMTASVGYNSSGFQHFSYKARGRYAEQIERWLEFFPRAQMLMLKSEEFFSDNQGGLDAVCDFLEIPRMDFPASVNKNEGRKNADDHDARAYLDHYFAGYNKDLSCLCGIDF